MPSTDWTPQPQDEQMEPLPPAKRDYPPELYADAQRLRAEIAERERNQALQRLAEAEEAIAEYDSDRRREWAAALRYARTELADTGMPGAANALDTMAADIDHGSLTPWADTPEPVAAPAEPTQDGPAGTDVPTGTPEGGGVGPENVYLPSMGRLVARMVQVPLGSTALVVRDPPKMLRETLCAAQAALGEQQLGDRRREHIARLGRLIAGCDRHRPLGGDGKHGNRHTATCGCDPAPSSVAADLTSPSPEPDSGTGWDRDWLGRMVAHLPSSTYDEPDLHGEALRQITALLADRDRMRDERRTLAMRCVEMERQRDEDRAFIDTVADERDAARTEVAEVAGRLANRDATLRARTVQLVQQREQAANALAELAEVTADRERYQREAANLEVQVRAYLRLIDAIGDACPGATHPIEAVNRLRDEANAHEGELGDMRAQLAAAETEVDRLRAELATARRDAAADALDRAARIAVSHEALNAATHIMELAREVRAGTRTVPGQPKPAIKEEPDA